MQPIRNERRLIGQAEQKWLQKNHLQALTKSISHMIFPLRPAPRGVEPNRLPPKKDGSRVEALSTDSIFEAGVAQQTPQ
jgi:hypothetical protein